MLIGDRLRELREQKSMSQGEIERETGLLRCYISRVENGYTVPSFETLEKFAHALKIPLYRLFYDPEEPPTMPKLTGVKTTGKAEWGSEGSFACKTATPPRSNERK